MNLINRGLSPTTKKTREKLHSILKPTLDDDPLRNQLISNWAYKITPLFSHLCRPDLYPLPGPVSIQLEITNKCNSRCITCDRWEWYRYKDAQDGLTTTDIKGLIDQLIHLGVDSLTISGGEPLLRSDLVEILRYCKNRKVHAAMLTNGLTLDAHTASEIIKNCDWIRISMDGSDGRLYQDIRRTNGFENAKKSILLLQTIRKRLNRPDFLIGINYVIQRKNIHDVKEMLRLANTIKVDSLLFKFPHGHGCFQSTTQQLKQILTLISSPQTLSNDKVSNLVYIKRFLSDYSNLSDVASGRPLRELYSRNRIRCFASYLTSIVDASGDIYPCCFLYYDNEKFKMPARTKFILGNIKNDDFENIWKSQNYNQFRKSLNPIDLNKFRECTSCTRHYRQNLLLTQLFEIYKALVSQTDIQTTTEIFKDCLREIPKVEPCVTWL